MVGHGGSSAGSYLADPTSPIPSHCASIVVTSTLRVNLWNLSSTRVNNVTIICVIQLQTPWDNSLSVFLTYWHT